MDMYDERKKMLDITRTVDESGDKVVIAECEGCGARTWSYGHGERSLRRCMVLMRDECECCDNDSDTFFTCEELDDVE